MVPADGVPSTAGLRRSVNLSPTAWRILARGAEKVARAVRDATRLRTVFHHHGRHQRVGGCKPSTPRGQIEGHLHETEVVHGFRSNRVFKNKHQAVSQGVRSFGKRSILTSM